MPPKCKFTKETVIQAALDIVREQGFAALTARGLATALGSSAKPIFGLFNSMEDVQNAVLQAANELYQAYIRKDMAADNYPPYKASGMAYIRFAKEEKELFKLLFMRDRTGESIAENREEIRPLLNLIMTNLGISENDAYRLHLEMWLYVHGIATMLATGYLCWDMSFVNEALTDAYAGLKHRYMKG